MRKQSAILVLFFVILGFFSPQLAFAQRKSDVIERIVVEGARRIEPDTIGSYMAIQVGDSFDRAKMDQSLKRLFATGLFSDVTLRREGNSLIVRVVENPIINRVAFEGNSKVKDADLTSEIQLRPRTVYTRTKVEAAVKRILAIYRASGRFAATVTPKVINRPQNRVDVVFEIKEGDVTGIRRISFIGNRVFSDSELRGVLRTKESAWWRFFSSADVYDPDRLNFDKELLRRYYLSRGYADFRVVSATAELTPDKRTFFITFAVEEGQRYRFGKLDVTTTLKGLEAKGLRRALKISTGDRYDASRVEKTVVALTDAAGTFGYAFVEVRPRTQRNRKERTIDVTFEIREGPRVFVERIEVIGNKRTRDEVIRRELRFAEGDAFNTAKVRLSRRRLRNLDFFEKVEITNRRGSAADKTIVTVKVSEKATGELSIGAGFSTDEGILGSFGLKERNFMGRGQNISARFLLSQRTSEVDFSFTEPYFLDRNLSVGLDAFRITRDFTDEGSFDTRSIGGRTKVGYEISENLRQRWTYEYNDTEIRDIDVNASPVIQAEKGTTVTSSIASELIYDTRDSRLNPTDGFFIAGTVQFAGLGGDQRFVKPSLRAGYYYSVFPGWVFGVFGEGGIAIGLDKDVTLTHRFFIGGNNFRGFEFAGVGPRDANTDDALGANKYYILTAELSFPLGLPKEFGIKGRVWTDVGSAWSLDPSGSFIQDSSSPRISVGVGFSWSSPFGPIRVDFGFPLVKQSFDKTQLFHINFGARF